MKNISTTISNSSETSESSKAELIQTPDVDTALISTQQGSTVQLSIAPPTVVLRESAALVQQATDAAKAALTEVIQNSDASVWPAIGEVIIEPTVIIVPGAPRIRILPRSAE